ncbi:CbbQ/NirQ/NorQ/GpvN family protein [Nitrospira defluvii]|nr:CbbQ/NirQ/NorQ/GpvN family protein [Nitrospira defluvii]
MDSESKLESFYLQKEPFYQPIGEEVSLFQAASHAKRPVLLKGPTGCGKSRFVSYMAYHLKRPLITVACHEDLTASDLVGRYLLKGDETVWSDGPLALAVKHGAICYLDEIVEARNDTTVVIHPLTDDRRILPIEKKGEVLTAVDDFMIVISYNPGYQSLLKNLKQSTRQRFIALDFQYPSRTSEMAIVSHEAGISQDIAERLVSIGTKVRNLKNHGLEEGVSTRLLIYAGQLIANGVTPHLACQAAIADAMTDDPDMRQSLIEIIQSFFE